MIDSEALFKAKQELNQFLEKNPQAREFQKQIDELLKKAGDNPQNRMMALQDMMLFKIAELQESFQKVKDAAESIINTERE